MSQAGFLLVANAAAGTAETEHVEAAAAVLRRAAATEIARTADTAELDDVLAAADGRRIVVAGGDGSVHAVVRALWRADPDTLAATPLGLIPLGTGNDLANGLELPTDPVEAANVCVDGTQRELDLVVCDFDGEVVVNASHAGLGAAAAERSEDFKERLGPLAYPLGALIAGVREAAWELVVRLDGRTVHEGRTLLVAVANAPTIGGGTRLVPPALPDDGLLDVVVVTAVGPAARLAFGAALRDAAHLERDDVLHLRGREVVITGEALPHDLDGEVVEDLSAATYRIEPRAWRMLVATTEPAAESI